MTLKIESLQSNISKNLIDTNNHTDLVCKNNFEEIEKLIGIVSSKTDEKIANLLTKIESVNKNESELMTKQLFENLEQKLEEFKIDQFKFKEEVTKLASVDALSLINNQIKQLNSKQLEDPILSKRNLNVCASCHQIPDKNLNTNSKQIHYSE